LFFFIGNTVVIEGETHSTNNQDPNSPNVTESHHQKEQIIIENINDPISTVTHQLEDIHVTVNNQPSVPNVVNEKATELKQNAAAGVHAVEEKAKEAAQNVQGRVSIILNPLNKIFSRKSNRSTTRCCCCCSCSWRKS